MITDAILGIIYYFILAITSPLRLLADATLPASVAGAITSANAYISIVDFVFPVITFIAIVALTITIEGFILLYKLIKWVWNKIPGIN